MGQAINSTTTCEVTMRRSPTDNWKPGESSTVDPPAVEAIGGDGDDRAPVETAAIGGDGGFTHANAWDVISGKGELVSDLQEFCKELDELPALRSAATLRSLSRIREELIRIPEGAALGDPVELRLQDVVVLARQMMSRLR